MEIKNLAIKYKDNKDVEIGDLNLKIDNSKKKLRKVNTVTKLCLTKPPLLRKNSRKKNKINTEIQ